MLPPMWQRRKVHTDLAGMDIQGDVTIQYLHSYETQTHSKSVSLMGLLLQPIYAFVRIMRFSHNSVVNNCNEIS